MSVSIKDVARAAGVSIASVSRVLTGKPGVSSENEQRIREIMDQLGYRPNMSARGLARKQTGNIAIMIPKDSFVAENSFYSTVLTGVAAVIDQKEYNMMLSFTSEQKKRLLAMQTVDGIIVLSPGSDEIHVDWLKGIGLPIVIIGNNPEELSFPSVRPDLEDGFRQAIKMLYKSGHRKIALINGPYLVLDRFTCYTKYQKVCAEWQLQESKQRIMEIDEDDWNRTVRAITKFLIKSKDITGVVCASDFLALGTIKAAHAIGWSIPDDLSIVGIGNEHTSEYTIPSLSAIQMDGIGLGKKAASMLVERIQGKKMRKQEVVCKMEFVNRGSISNPRG